MAKRRRRRVATTGGLGGLVIAFLIAAFGLLRSNPALQSSLPPAVRTVINSINLPTGIPALSLQAPANQPPGNQPPPGNAQIGVRTKTSGCQAVNALPDRACTPGVVLPG